MTTPNEETTQSFENGCEGKTRHQTKERALNAMWHVNRLNESKGKIVLNSVYKCEHCRTWHFGRAKMNIQKLYKNVLKKAEEEANENNN